ncbi:MAG TPA: dihydroorotate dehydrogenase-like protein [Candidatus Omnitrophota bacterium]|nr:dihydroorotate dehydrogenase-like protein [Candidatus Omnitrophota bacterium]
MDLTTTYLGLKLKNPLIISASPLSEEIDNFRRLEDAGASCIVHYSLFEEQITGEIYEADYYQTFGSESFAESLSYFPKPSQFILGPQEYCEHIRLAKKAVDIPIIASLNGHSLGGWTKYARHLEEAGADALELNIYYLATDPEDTSEKIENNYVEVLKAVKSVVKIPVAVKLSPYFSAMANMAVRLDQAGADGLVLFNRFYQPDIDLENLKITPNVLLSNSPEMRLPMRWIAILFGRIKADMAATSGIHTAADVLKLLMVGAKATMLCSILLRKGIDHLGRIKTEMVEWMKEHEYRSVAQMQGSISQRLCTDPELFERANYMKVLKSYHSGKR